MAEHQGLLSGGWDKVRHNKRYIFWFYLLNVTLAWLGTSAFSSHVHEILDHSLRANSLLHGFDVATLTEMLARPEFGPMMASEMPAAGFAVFFFLLTAVFLPGVLQGYASTYRLPREDFFRACGRNLWRFIRLMIVAGIVMGILAGGMFAIRDLLLKAAEQSTNELLPFYVSMASLLLIFLLMTALRVWFDLAQTDVVLSDQGAVRKSIGAGFRHTWRSLGRLLGSYVVTAVVAAIVLVAGLWIWMRLVPPASVFGAVVVSQLTLLLLLIPRFWQRGVAVMYYLQNMVEPIAAQSFTSSPVAASVNESVTVDATTPQEPQT
jgi:hypothetical protein